MKKAIMILFAGVLGISAIQCKKENSTKSEVKLESKSKESVDQIIQFNNDYIQISDRRSTYLNGLDRFLEGAEAKSKGKNVIALIPPMYISVGVFPKEVPDVFGDATSEINSNYKIVNEKFDAIKKSIENIKSYLSAEDFKDDKGAQFQTWKTQILKDREDYYAAQDLLFGKMQPITDAAEEEVLKDHPLKDQIINSKKCLNLVNKAATEIQSQYDAQKYDAQSVQKIYDELEKAVTTNTAMKVEISDPAYATRKNAFERYNKSLSDFLGAMRKLMRDSQESGIIGDREINDLESPYKSVISTYNSFVD